LARVLQVRWSDEDVWRDVRPLSAEEENATVLKNAVDNWRESMRRYPHHRFFPRLRVIKR